MHHVQLLTQEGEVEQLPVQEGKSKGIAGGHTSC